MPAADGRPGAKFVRAPFKGRRLNFLRPIRRGGFMERSFFRNRSSNASRASRLNVRGRAVDKSLYDVFNRFRI
jgi:hypothetical protein